MLFGFKRLTARAVNGFGVAVASTDIDCVQRTVVITVAMVFAVFDCATDVIVFLIAHQYYLLFRTGFRRERLIGSRMFRISLKYFNPNFKK